MDLNCVRFEIQHLELIDLEGTKFTISFSRFPTALIFFLTPGHKQTRRTISKNDVGTITWYIHKTNHALVPFGSPMKPKATATYRA
jgi:hypothetical protein